MLLSSWPLHDLAGFLQIVSWIVLPVLLLAIAITIFAHYRQKKRNVSTHIAPADIPAQYDALKEEFRSLAEKYRQTDEELSFINAEMRRQDFVIMQLREDLADKERQLKIILEKPALHSQVANTVKVH